MDTRQKFLIASIVLFLMSLPWELIGAVLTNPLVLLFFFDAVGTPADPTVAYVCILIGVPALFASWGTATAGKGGLALIFGSIALIAALIFVVHAASAAHALSLGTVVTLALWLGSPVTACLAGWTSMPRALNR